MNKILFILERYNYDSNDISLLKELIFILLTLYEANILLKRSLISIVEDETTRDTNLLLKDLNINILKVEAVAYYKLARNKNNKLFSLIINENNIATLTSRPSHNLYILVNKLYLYRSKRKYKKCYESNTLDSSNNSIRINNTKSLIYKKILVKLFSKYYNFINVFDRTKTNKLSLYRIYDYKLEFIEDYNKIDLSKSRIYLISGYKLK